MKSLYKYLFSFVTLLVAAGIFTGCSEDETGKPFVSYVRVTDPTSSDSLLVSAGQGQMVAIMGRNLGSIRQLWFNDLQATLNPSFITDESIISRVPTPIPTAITNSLRMYFANGDSLIHEFEVDISEPRLDRMKSEYVAVGGEAVIYGDYFYEPLTVTFAGGVEGELASVEDQEIHVIVPEGAQPGPITVTTNFGTTESDFWFLDNRNHIASFDVAFSGLWQGPAAVVASDPFIAPVNGKFLRANRDLGPWPFFELYGGPAESSAGLETRNIPEAAFVNPGAYSLKFEVNTLKTLTGATMRLYLGSANNSQLDAQRQSTYYIWQPNIHTEGEWETITIPWEDVYDANKNFPYNASGYGMFIYFHGPGASSTNFGLDNMRVVPNTAE